MWSPSPDAPVVRRYEAYDPTITRTNIDTGSGEYRHVPSIMVKSSSHILGAYLFNDSSALESAAGQRVGFIRSTNNGATWTSKTEELNSATYSTNPLNPASENDRQSEAIVAYDEDADEEIALTVHRSAIVGQNRAFIAFRDASAPDPAVDKWTSYCFRFTTSTNALNLSNTDISGNTYASGYKGTYTIDGTEYDVFPFMPVFAQNGDLVIPVMFLHMVGGSHRVGFIIRSGSSWSLGGIVPLGIAGEAALWEPTTWQADDGTWYCQARNNGDAFGGASYDNHVIASSADLLSWTPFTFLNEDLHSNRHVKIRARDNLWVGIGSTHESNRNNLALSVSGDGHEWVHGVTIGAETDGTDWTQYSDIAVHDGTAYVLYSEMVNYASSTGPNTIRFARFPLPADLPLMGSDKNYYELNGGTRPSVSGSELTIPPRMSGAIPTDGEQVALTIKARVTAAPNAVPYRLVSVGDERTGYFVIEYRDDGGVCKLFAGNTEVRSVLSPTSFATFNLIIDRRRGFVSALGRSRPIQKFARVYLGDDAPGTSDQAGNIVYDASGTVLSRYREFPRAMLPDYIPVVSKNPHGIADLAVDGAAGSQTAVRHRQDGATAAADIYTGSEWRRQVTGVNVQSSDGTLLKSLIRHEMKIISLATPTVVTIASDAITATQGYHLLETEAGASTDNLATINGLSGTDTLLLQINDTDHRVTIKHGTGNIFCGSDRTLSSVADTIEFIKRGPNWHMRGYSDNN